MKTCVRCGAGVWALYPDEHENSGQVCKACFDVQVPPKKEVPKNMINFKPKKLVCPECRTRFKTVTLNQKYCCVACSQKVSMREYKRRMKEKGE